MRRRDFLGGLLTTGLALSAHAAWAERPVSIVVPSLPNGEAGATVRILQPYLEQALACPVVLDFRPGAGGIIGLTAGAQAAPDGATLTLLTPAVTLAPWISRRMDCSPVDFTPVGQISFTPAALLVRSDAPYAALSDLLARRAATLAVPAVSDWDPPQVAQGLFLARAGLTSRAVSGLTTEAERIGALVAGDIDFAFAPLDQALDSSVASQVRILAVSAPARVPRIPAVPSLRELGFEIAVGGWRTLALPAGTPRALVERLGAVLKTIMESRPLRTELTSAGLAPGWLGPTEARQAVLGEYRDAGALFAALGVAVRKEMVGLRTG